MCSFVNLCEFLHTEGYRRIDVYSQGEFPGRVWGCWYQLWVVSSCLWFLEHLSASRWTHPVCWQNPARTNTQTHQHGQTQQMWLLWHQKYRNIKIWTKPPCVTPQHNKQGLRKIIKCFDKVWSTDKSFEARVCICQKHTMLKGMSHRSCPWCVSMAFSVRGDSLCSVCTYCHLLDQRNTRFHQLLLAKTNTGGTALWKKSNCVIIKLSFIHTPKRRRFTECPTCSVPNNKCRWSVLYLKKGKTTHKGVYISIYSYLSSLLKTHESFVWGTGQNLSCNSMKFSQCVS